MTAPFGLIEKAVSDLIEERYPLAANRTGGVLSHNRGEGLYVWLGLVSGATDQRFGEWIIDIDVFHDGYGLAMKAALDIEAALLSRGRSAGPEMRIDTITQNEAPVERAWDDEEVFRIGASYVFTARRSG